MKRFVFDPDFHESKEAFPLVYDLGRFSLEWNMVEHWFSGLIWNYLGDLSTGKTITGVLGNQSKADVLIGLARQRGNNRALLERVEFACRAFNILRENRNMLMHSHSIFQNPEGKPEWRRASGKSPDGHVSVFVDLRDLELLIAQTCTLGRFVIELVIYTRPGRDRRKKCRLPDLFEMPSKLQTSQASSTVPL